MGPPRRCPCQPSVICAHVCERANSPLGPRGEQWEKVENWTQGEKRGTVSGVLSAPLPLLAQEDP
eukprot:1180431-Prorocentrum_minimum.AAC.1